MLFSPVEGDLLLLKIDIHPNIPIPKLILSLKWTSIYQLKNVQVLSSKSFKSGIREALDMVHPQQTLFSICRPVKLEHSFSPCRKQWWDRHRTDIFVPKEKKYSNKFTQSKSETKQVSSIRFKA